MLKICIFFKNDVLYNMIAIINMMSDIKEVKDKKPSVKELTNILISSKEKMSEYLDSGYVEMIKKLAMDNIGFAMKKENIKALIKLLIMCVSLVLYNMLDGIISLAIFIGSLFIYSNGHSHINILYVIMWILPSITSIFIINLIISLIYAFVLFTLVSIVHDKYTSFFNQLSEQIEKIYEYLKAGNEMTELFGKMFEELLENVEIGKIMNSISDNKSIDIEEK